MLSIQASGNLDGRLSCQESLTYQGIETKVKRFDFEDLHCTTSVGFKQILKLHIGGCKNWHDLIPYKFSTDLMITVMIKRCKLQWGAAL